MRKLSLDRTTSHKVLAALSIALFGLIAILMFVWPPSVRQGGTIGALSRFQALACQVVLVVVSWSLYKAILRARDVFLEGDRLFISAHGRTIMVPLREVEKVWSLVRSPWSVFIRFRHPTEYGRVVTFLPPPPPRRWFRFSQHPLVDELQSLTEEASKPSGPREADGAT